METVRFEKIIHQGAFCWCHMVVMEQLRQPYGFANQSLCPSDILIIQVKANCGVSDKLLVFDEEEVQSWSVTLVEDKDEFLYCLL